MKNFKQQYGPWALIIGASSGIGRAMSEQLAQQGMNIKATVVPGFINKLYTWENRLIPRSWPMKLFGLLIKRAMIVKGDRSKGRSRFDSGNFCTVVQTTVLANNAEMKQHACF